jgi:hypothetical protein
MTQGFGHSNRVDDERAAASNPIIIESVCAVAAHVRARKLSDETHTEVRGVLLSPPACKPTPQRDSIRTQNPFAFLKPSRARDRVHAPAPYGDMCGDSGRNHKTLLRLKSRVVGVISSNSPAEPREFCCWLVRSCIRCQAAAAAAAGPLPPHQKQGHDGSKVWHHHAPSWRRSASLRTCPIDFPSHASDVLISSHLCVCACHERDFRLSRRLASPPRHLI